MSHVPIHRGKEPIRLFKSDFLEAFTHIHPAVIVAIWVPVIVYFLARAIILRRVDISPLYLPAGWALGLFLWTPAEYLTHRFLFHLKPRNLWQERVSFLIHGVHHAQPLYKKRLVMPPVLSIPLGALFYGLFYLVFAMLLRAFYLVAPVFAGFVTGYLAYDLMHYAFHHFKINAGVFKTLRRHHMQHHQNPDRRFGVSSPLWDIVFGTEPARM